MQLLLQNEQWEPLASTPVAMVDRDKRVLTTVLTDRRGVAIIDDLLIPPDGVFSFRPRITRASGQLYKQNNNGVIRMTMLRERDTITEDVLLGACEVTWSVTGGSTTGGGGGGDTRIIVNPGQIFFFYTTAMVPPTMTASDATAVPIGLTFTDQAGSIFQFWYAYTDVEAGGYVEDDTGGGATIDWLRISSDGGDLCTDMEVIDTDRADDGPQLTSPLRLEMDVSGAGSDLLTVAIAYNDVSASSGGFGLDTFSDIGSDFNYGYSEEAAPSTFGWEFTFVPDPGQHSATGAAILIRATCVACA